MLGSGGPLCPNLQELRLNIDTLEVSDAHLVASLLSPSLRSITLYASINPLYESNDTGELTACAILDALRFRNANISHLSYEGYTSSRIIARIMDFSNLNSLSIPSCLTKTEKDYKTIIASFLETRSLTTLEINLGGYPNDVLYQLGKWFEALVSLTSLNLRGPLRSIHHCIRDLNPITSISSFGLSQDLTIHHPKGQTVHLVPLFAAIFPNLHTLHLENNNDTLPKMVTLDDLMSFRQRPLQALDLINCLKSTKLANDIVEILRVLPTLERLWIEGGKVSARYILPIISSSAPSLQDLTLPLRSPGVSDGSAVNEVVCPLRCLSAPSFKNIADTRSHVRNIIKLFPSLTTLSKRTREEGESVTVNVDMSRYRSED